MFYDYNKVYSYNAILNFIIGERGVGKTYGALKSAINRYKKYGEEFVYIRRYKTELKRFSSILDPLIANEEFKGHTIKVHNKKILFDGKTCGYGIELSTAVTLKSSSYEKVKTIIFDEYQIDKGAYHYLPNECEQFLDIVETIGRLRDIRVLLLSNAISVTNPYFDYFNITLPYNSDIKLFKDGLILVNYIKNEEYREAKKNTRFGKLVEGTRYGTYAIDNVMLRDSKVFINKKDGNYKFLFTLYLNDKEYGVWKDFDKGVMNISKDYDPKYNVKVSISCNDHNENTILATRTKNRWWLAIVEHYKLGSLTFENQSIKNETMEVIKLYLH